MDCPKSRSCKRVFAPVPTSCSSAATSSSAGRSAVSSSAGPRSSPGGATLPEQTVPGWALAASGSSADKTAERLRLGTPSVFGRIQEGRTLVDLRTVQPEDDDALFQRLLDSV